MILFETSLQIYILCAFVYFGIWGGIVIQIAKYLNFNNCILKNVLDFISIVGCFVLFLYALNMYNYGEIRLYCFLCFALGVFVEQKTISKILDSFIKMCYNISNKIIIKLKRK